MLTLPKYARRLSSTVWFKAPLYILIIWSNWAIQYIATFRVYLKTTFSYDTMVQVHCKMYHNILILAVSSDYEHSDDNKDDLLAKVSNMHRHLYVFPAHLQATAPVSSMSPVCSSALSTSPLITVSSSDNLHISQSVSRSTISDSPIGFTNITK